MNKRNKMRKNAAKPKKRVDLGPWLSIFKMLRSCVRLDYLQMDAAKHEAYITQPAIHALSGGSDPEEQVKDGGIVATAGRIRDYAAWLSGEGKVYLQANFAVHVVKPDEPHDLIYTFVFTRRLRFFKWRDKVDVITYPVK